MIQRKFILGDQWVYYKLYCGKRTADTILTEIIKPLTEKLLTNKYISQWFFIRYLDPESHIRIRFYCEDISKINEVIKEVKKAIQYYNDNDIIWKVQLDTYNREIERYGIETMLFSEQLFYIDSNVCLEALGLIDDDNLLFMFAVRSINDILDFFHIDLKNKLKYVKKNLDAFKSEFNSNKLLTKDLNIKYKTLKEHFIGFMDTQSHNEYQLLINLLNNKNISLRKLEIKIKNNNKLEGLLSSYIHMMVNRIFRDKQRLHELVCYDFLHKYYNFKMLNNNK